MTEGEAYRVLELEPGASEAAVRDARKLLAKVWHPDRHASDPALQAVAEKKLAAINAAFETLRDAGYPLAPPPRAPSEPGAPKVRKVDPPIEFVTRRRVRPWVIVVFALALGAGAYLAVMQLGGNGDGAVATREPTKPAPVIVPKHDPLPVAPSTDPLASPPPDAAPSDASATSDPLPTSAGSFTLGSTPDEVRASQGAPERITNVVTLTWYYDMGARIEFEHGVVVGWFEMEPQLHVALQPRDAAVAEAARQRGHWKIGSSKDEVLALQGTPLGIINVVDETWHYHFGSTVTFDGRGRVAEYNNFDGSLKVGN